MNSSADQASAVPALATSAWRARLLRGARFTAWSVASLLLLWLLAWAGLPPLLKWQLERQASAALGRSISVERVDLKPWSLELELKGLRIADAQGQGEQFSLGRFYVDLDWRSLLRLAPVLDAVEFDQPQLKLRHLGKGQYDIDDLLERLLKPDQPPSALPRFALFHLQLHGGAIDFIDEPLGRTQQIRQLTLDLPFLSSLEQQREEKIEPSLNFLLNGDPVDAKAMLLPFAQARQGEARLRSTALDLKPWLPYWPAKLPLRPTRGQLAFDFGMRLSPAAQDDQASQKQQAPLSLTGHLALQDVELELAGASQAQPTRLSWNSLRFDGQTRLGWPIQSQTGELAVELENGQLQIDGLTLHENKQQPLRLGKLLLQDAYLTLAERRLFVGKISLEQPELQLQRDARQRWMFENWLAALGQETSGAGTKAGAGSGTKQRKGQPDRTDEPIQPNTADRVAGWQLQLDKLQLVDGRLGFLDHSTARPVRLQLEALQLSTGRWSNAPQQDQSMPLDLSLKLVPQAAGKAGTMGALRYQGQVKLPSPAADGHPAQAFSSQGKLELDELPLQQFEPYFAAALNLELLRAELGLRASVDLSLPPEGLQLALRGDGEIERLRTSTLDPAERLLDWKSLGLRGLQLDLKAGALSRLKVAETALSDYYAHIVIDPKGLINLQQLLRQPEASAKPAAPQAQLEFGPITLVKGQVDFQDHFIRPNYSAHLSELTGRLGGFSNRPTQPGAAPELAALSLRGKAEGQASLEIEGQLNPLAQPLALDIRAKVDDLELPPLSPYSVKYAGHGIERGKLGMDVRYQVAPDGQLQANNQILLKQLQFGERVEGSEAPNLPIRLAVSLLADSNGVIDLNLPISGSINDPQFRIGPIVWRMVLNLIGKAITAPFALIAHALGGSAEDFNQLDFALGSASLDAAAQARLEQIAQTLNKRSDLQLTLQGQSHLEGERSAYQQAQLQQRLLEEKKRQLARSGKLPDTVEPPTTTEAPKLLAEVYRRADMPKPRNLIGLARELPTAEMEKLLLAAIPVDADRMRELALDRAGQVRDELVRLGVDHNRIYLLAPTSPPTNSQEGWRPAVMLGIKQE